MDLLKPGYVDFYFQGRIFELAEKDSRGVAECLAQQLSDYAKVGDCDAIRQLQTLHHIRDVGLDAEAGTNDLRNPLWLKVDTARRLVGTTGKEVNPHVADLIRSAGIVGDGRAGNPIAFCIPNERTGHREIWHIDPREIAVLSRRQIEDMLVEWVIQAIEQGNLPCS